MSPRRKTGPKPQRVELEDGIDALLEQTVGRLGGSAETRTSLREYTLQLLELVGVDSAGVTVTSDETPRAKRIRRPGHGEDV